MSAELQHPEHFRCGYVALLGEPNVGKSTLMNTLLDQKISIVTPKPQTTRHRILGIRSTSDSQVIFLDTPGIIKPSYLLQEVMMEQVSSALADADVSIFMVDGTRPADPHPLGHPATEAVARLRGLGKPVFLVINKVDLLDKGVLLPMMATYAGWEVFREIHPISALTHDGTDKLLETVVSALPLHPPLYPLDIVSEQSERFFVGEIIREKIFERYKQEIPYSTTVDIVEFRERQAAQEGDQPTKWFIRADVYVERDSQKGILIGKKGAALREIGMLARGDIEEFLQHPVFLELHVRVRPKWRDEREWLSRLGYK